MTATPIIAAFPKYPGFTENLWFITTGFLLVVGILAILALFTSLVGQRFKAAAAKAARPAPASTATPVAAKGPPDADDPNIPYVLAAATKAMTEDLATDKHLPFLLAAAVDEVLQGRPHRIVTVRAFGENWAREGRRDISDSHRVR